MPGQHRARPQPSVEDRAAQLDLDLPVQGQAGRAVEDDRRVGHVGGGPPPGSERSPHTRRHPREGSIWDRRRWLGRTSVPIAWARRRERPARGDPACLATGVPPSDRHETDPVSARATPACPATMEENDATPGRHARRLALGRRVAHVAACGASTPRRRAQHGHRPGDGDPGSSATEVPSTAGEAIDLFTTATRPRTGPTAARPSSATGRRRPSSTRST